MKMKEWDVCPKCGARRIAVCRFCGTIGDNFPLADLDLILAPEHAESVAEGYNTEEDCYDDGDQESTAAKPFLADAIGSALAGGGVGTETVVPQSDENENEKEHQCKCHGDGECKNHEEGHECKCQNVPQRRRHSMVELTQPLDVAPEVEEGAEEYPLAVQCPCCEEVLYPKFLNVCKKCGHPFEDGIDPEQLSDAHFYNPAEDDPKEDENAEKGATGCCIMLLAVTLFGLTCWLV